MLSKPSSARRSSMVASPRRSLVSGYSSLKYPGSRSPHAIPHNYRRPLQTLLFSKPSSAIPLCAGAFYSRLSLILHISPSPALLRTSASSILATLSSTISSRQPSFPMRTGRRKLSNPSACTFSVPQPSTLLSLRSVLSRESSQFPLRELHHLAQTRRLCSFPARGRYLCLNSFDMRLFPP